MKQEKQMLETIKKNRGYKKKHLWATMAHLDSEVFVQIWFFHPKKRIIRNSSKKGNKADER